LAKVGN